MRCWVTKRRTRAGTPGGVAAWALVFAALVAPPTVADEPAVTVLADFEGASVAARIVEVRNALAGDCAVERVLIPARGQGSLAVRIGATAPRVSVTCDLTFREATRFRQAERVACYCWINEGEIELVFRLRDARNQLFETPPQPVTLRQRWVSVGATLKPEGLRRVRGDAPLSLPLEIQGCRLVTQRLGKQTVYLDDLEVEHRVGPEDLVRGEFEFDEPTRIYEPGAAVGAAIVLENRSRRSPLNLTLDLAWTRPDGSVLQRQQAAVSLPVSGTDYRSRRRLDFSQRISDSGLYRLVAQVRSTGWTFPHTLETTIAVTPSNRRVSRGRSTLFGLRSNLLREPELDQMLEISVARDLGVNLLALDVPWRLVEPKAGTYDLDRLAPLVDALGQKDVAATVVLTEPPEWLPEDEGARLERFGQFIAAAARRFGERIGRYQVAADVLPALETQARLDAFAALRAALREQHPRIELLPPPVPVTDAEPPAELAAYLRAHPDVPLTFRTAGESAGVLRQLDRFRQRGGFAWQPAHAWYHEAEPCVGAGYDTDAEQLLRHYVAGAAAGVGSVLWFDLRDDDNDPTRPETLRGLVRRDFSPKLALLGYASAAGTLTGYRYAGPLRGAPASFDSALFIGANRQVAALLPQPNRIHPAVVFPLAGAPGELAALDFERRALPALDAAGTAFAPVARPFFLVLTLRAPQAEPQLTLAKPWLRVPQTVFYGAGQSFAVEVDLPTTAARSYLQLRRPKDSALQSSMSAITLPASPDETVLTPVELTALPDREVPREDLTLRVARDGKPLDVPLVARRMIAVSPLLSGQPLVAAPHRVGKLAARHPQPTATAELYLAHDTDSLHVAIVVDDDRTVPLGFDRRRQVTGDHIVLGLAAEGGWHAVHARFDAAARDWRPEPLYGSRPEWLSGWTGRVAEGPGRAATFHFKIPLRTVTDGEPSAGRRLLFAVSYVDDDADGFSAAALTWGQGLTDGPATGEYEWLQLGSARTP